MTKRHSTLERSALLSGAVIAALLLGLFHSVVAEAVQRGPTRLVDATHPQITAANRPD